MKADQKLCVVGSNHVSISPLLSIVSSFFTAGIRKTNPPSFLIFSAALLLKMRGFARANRIYRSKWKRRRRRRIEGRWSGSHLLVIFAKRGGKTTITFLSPLHARMDFSVRQPNI